MTWLRIDDKFARHRKVHTLSDRAFRLHVTALADCCERLTDGFVSEAEIAILPSVAAGKQLRSAVAQLIASGLWTEGQHDQRRGYYIHDFLDWNPSKAEVEKARAAGKQRAQRSRDRGSNVPVRRTFGERAPDVQRPVPDPTHIHTDQVDKGQDNTDPTHEPDLFPAHDRPEVRAFDGQWAESEQAKTLERAKARRERDSKRTPAAHKRRAQRREGK